MNINSFPMTGFWLNLKKNTNFELQSLNVRQKHSGYFFDCIYLLTKNIKVYILNIYNIVERDYAQISLRRGLAQSYAEKENHMDIILNNSSGVSIYEQIEEQIKSQIMTGVLKEGDALPSMRVLAKDLKISIITTKRAYEDLERDGFIESITGKGSFVKGINSDLVKENMMAAIEEYLDKALDKAILGKVSIEELKEMLTLLYEEKMQ